MIRRGILLKRERTERGEGYAEGQNAHTHEDELCHRLMLDHDPFTLSSMCYLISSDP